MKFLSICFFTLIIISCQNNNQKDKKLIIEEYGLSFPRVEVDLNKIETWEELTHQIDSINCLGNISKITITKGNKKKLIFFLNGCNYSAPVKTINLNDAIRIFNDTIFKSIDLVFPIDSLSNVIKKDYYNNGNNPNWSDNPESLVIYISQSKFDKQKLLNTLDVVTDSYKKITSKTDVSILLVNMAYYRAPPKKPLEL